MRPLRPTGPRRFRARDADRRRARRLRRCCSSCSRAPRPRAPASRWTPGVGARRRAGASARPPAGSPTALPLAHAAHDATAWLSPDDDLGDAATASRSAPRGTAAACRRSPPDAFDPAQLGAQPPAQQPLQTLLVTGDSMSSRSTSSSPARLAADGVQVDPRRRTWAPASPRACSSTGRKLSASRSRSDQPDAVVVFIGANEGFPLTRRRRAAASTAAAPTWAAAYANRVRADDRHLPPARARRASTG